MQLFDNPMTSPQSLRYCVGVISVSYTHLDVYKRQQTSRAVDDVNLDIREGQFIAILGHNGSGKSTLAKHINALLVPTEGTLWVDSMDTSSEAVSYTHLS